MPRKRPVLEEHINPFTPDSPVEPALFAGRKTEIKQIQRALLSTHLGKAEHILVQGERWIGKSSVALYAEMMAGFANMVFERDDVSFLPCCCRLGSCRTLDEMCVVMLDSFKRSQNSVKAKVFEILSQVKGLQVGPIGVQLAETRKANFLVPTFPSLLERLLDETRSSYSGILIILDEVEIISDLSHSASFLKNLFEQLMGNGYRNVMFLMCATPRGIDAFTHDHPSFPRLFRFVELPTFTKDESKELINKALAKGKPQVAITKEAMELVHHYSDGFPGVVQELAYGAFEANTDSKITNDDVRIGVLGSDQLKGALDTLYDKHFRKILTRDILSDRYRTILNALARSDKEVVTYKDLREDIEPEEGWQVAPYLGQLTKRGIVIHMPGKRGEYRLASRMLRLYLLLEAIREKP